LNRFVIYPPAGRVKLFPKTYNVRGSTVYSVFNFTFGSASL